MFDVGFLERRDHRERVVAVEDLACKVVDIGRRDRVQSFDDLIDRQQLGTGHLALAERGHAAARALQAQDELAFEPLSDAFELIVCDNGVGLPEEVDLDAPKSFGLDLVGILARQLKGRLKIVRGAGTEIRLTFSAPGQITTESV